MDNCKWFFDITVGKCSSYFLKNRTIIKRNKLLCDPRHKFWDSFYIRVISTKVHNPCGGMSLCEVRERMIKYNCVKTRLVIYSQKKKNLLPRVI